MQCFSTTLQRLNVKKVANKIVKHIVKLIWPTVYLVIAYRVDSLNMGRGEGQQRPSAQHGQPTAGVGGVCAVYVINHIISKLTQNTKLF